MGKHIVILSDGTGNTANKGRGTNVFKLFEALDLTGHRSRLDLTAQIAFYDDGVGTQSFKPVKLVAGAVGLGLARNVRQLYKELCRVYDPGDRIFLFGFSRGAFTIRSLAGLIGGVGILDRSRLDDRAKFARMVGRAYRMYKRFYRPTVWQRLRGHDRRGPVAQFRERWCLRDEVRIAFLGVWDTVDAVGLPFALSGVVNEFHRFKFPDRVLGSYVDHACHALAIDDARASFHPLLWDERDESAGACRIEQVWFAGAHANVGGGYPKQGMSIVALDWMMARAGALGLRFNEADLALYRTHAHVDDQLYDPRAGLQILYRWRPRDVVAISRANGIERAALHLSVLERIARGTDDYAPGNLPPDGRIVFTPIGDPAADRALGARARKAEEALRRAHGQATDSLLVGQRYAHRLGVASYWVMLASLFGLLGWAVLAIGLARPLAALGGAAIVLAIAARALSYVTDSRMSAAFSSFWHRAQQDLREALKSARGR